MDRESVASLASREFEEECDSAIIFLGMYNEILENIEFMLARGMPDSSELIEIINSDGRISVLEKKGKLEGYQITQLGELSDSTNKTFVLYESYDPEDREEGLLFIKKNILECLQDDELRHNEEAAYKETTERFMGRLYKVALTVNDPQPKLKSGETNDNPPIIRP